MRFLLVLILCMSPTFAGEPDPRRIQNCFSNRLQQRNFQEERTKEYEEAIGEYKRKKSMMKLRRLINLARRLAKEEDVASRSGDFIIRDWFDDYAMFKFNGEESDLSDDEKEWLLSRYCASFGKSLNDFRVLRTKFFNEIADDGDNRAINLEIQSIDDYFKLVMARYIVGATAFSQFKMSSSSMADNLVHVFENFIRMDRKRDRDPDFYYLPEVKERTDRYGDVLLKLIFKAAIFSDKEVLGHVVSFIPWQYAGRNYQSVYRSLIDTALRKGYKDFLIEKIEASLSQYSRSMPPSTIAHLGETLEYIRSR